ncbi:cell division protein FtsI (penicillin-binding protein 3) [Novosphingobium hassiacum]|uniref:Cell division protein FtsI (Penicillin-binding protein 3) n=1 Tax=Novosphingobium hassiacum TaxID=173676 RepID=A0A7W5ZYC7_9SPHN|nr:penicillin-binding protein 2 [Novosphingobium hassiacum]MBB3861358.1 cell division protein FtsI (penicillin-binding protein 3) [Novosphingobium hassiacum]
MNALTASAAIASGRVRLANVRQRSLVEAKVRVLVVAALFAFVGLAALIRIAQLGFFEDAPERRSLTEALLPPRGEITDRNGFPLARAFPAYALWYNPKALGEKGSSLVKSPEEVAKALLQIFPDADYNDLVRRLKSDKPSYLRRRVMPEEANRLYALGEPALEFPRENQRYYPQGSLGAHVLGYVDGEGGGHVGMEQVLEKRLLDPAQRGTPIALSIDMRVQGALEDELGRGMMETEAKGAAGVILDVDTGEVVALASLPSFNPNRSDMAYNDLVFNKVTNQVYELGSTFKPFTVAAAIDDGVITDLSVRYPSNRPLAIGGFQIRDSHNFGASLNVPEALIHSSNIVTAQVADKLGGPALKRTMAALGMNERPYIELPARGFPLWPRGTDKNGDWARITTMTVSYGHGIAVTPLHLAAGYSALVNGGIWRPATLYKVDPAHVAAGRRVFKASTSARMRQLLRMIVVDGTGRSANAQGFRVGGKTGSAEKPGGKGGYNRTSLIATFAAAFPMDKPRYVVVAMLDEPKGTAATSFQRTAAWNTGPIVGRLIPRIGPLLGVVPDDSRDIDISDLSPLVGNGKGE